ncbi:RusA family crossover junction endodeoxyribonuclease [Roseibium sp. RKSG952]|uniref:RusA family crossover junction endodeoxyribonuclease n=1 Tax=Roseibium sp. RKSG952 TaxID=2529384 RepID=UPI0012BC4AAD|nr:RusA family crossover junction endodeoxyribonuclease [Roseibium sp. RKSG952]MTH95409.1 RusA family crossover junction endodeoxyribonuclease [Roseibium sp. RKSG952]
MTLDRNTTVGGGREAGKAAPGSPASSDQPAEVIIEISGRPVAKGRPRYYRGRAVTPSDTRAYEQLIRSCAKFAMNGRTPLDGPLNAIIEVFLPVPVSWSARQKREALDGRTLPVSRPDLDNYVKAVLDGLNGIVFEDDAQVVRIVARKSYSDRPCVIAGLLPMSIP